MNSLSTAKAPINLELSKNCCFLTFLAIFSFNFCYLMSSSEILGLDCSLGSSLGISFFTTM
jgi:hypothetical protein